MTWLDDAKRVTREDRQQQYGSPLVNFLRTALQWSAYKGVIFTPIDVAWMMVCVKSSRERQAHKDDNYLDAIGYLACVQQMDEELRARGWRDGVKTFHHMTMDSMAWLLKQIEEEKDE